MKKCPFCAEEIQDEAIKCKHCGEFLDARSREALLTNKPKQPFWFKTSFILLAICMVGPLALPLIWFRPNTSRWTKIILTLLILLISYVFYLVFMNALTQLNEYYDLMFESL
jgi:uncharacterized membrane protein YvbJ